MITGTLISRGRAHNYSLGNNEDIASNQRGLTWEHTLPTQRVLRYGTMTPQLLQVPPSKYLFTQE